ncbi:MAG TPA: cation:proton antiporter [Synergistales bacterium]|nr:cation:proton antiporter [Synergistales bacterium]HRU91063.1 cation:proton antiporter [Thermovirgaceae bacterium]
MADLLCRSSHTMEILISLSVVLLAGFLLTRLTKLAKLPDVTGYIIAGILIGPHILKLVPPRMIEDMGFISDIALAFIAFGVGRFFRKEVFRETGFGVITITLMESLLAGVIVTLSLHYLFHLDWDFSLLLGAIGTATAPASTTVTIRQYHARGNFVNILLQVVALDDGVCLIVFSIALAIVNAGDGAGVCISEIVMPIIFNALALALGFASGFILSKLRVSKRSDDDRVILTISLLLGIAGLCVAVDISPLLSCMLFGTTYVNMAKDRELFKYLDRLSPPIFSLFFVVSGMSLDLSTLGSMGVIGASYFIIRILGKYFGAYLGCLIAKTPRNVRNYLGLALIPQAGVAIGLAFLGKRVLPEATGHMLLAIILSSSFLYELIGPVSAKIALIYSGSIQMEQVEE